jgi:hypothetical protein
MRKIIVFSFVGLLIKEMAKKRGLLLTFQGAKLSMGLLLILMGLIILPPNSHATKQTPPIEVELTFENPQQWLDSVEPLFLRVTPDIDIPYATIDIILPEGVHLINGDTFWSGSLNQGETTEMLIFVQIVETGRYSILANVRCYSSGYVLEEDFLFGRRAHLNMIVSDQEVRVSTDPFILMDLNKAETPEEKENILRLKGIEAPTPLPTPVDAPTLPKFLMPKEEDPSRTKEEPQVRNDIEARSTFRVEVSGRATYKDSVGGEHPIRYAKVQIIDVDVSFHDIMGEGYTNTDGRYSVVATGSDIDGSGPDIKVRVLAAIAGNAVASVGPDASIENIYSMESSTHDNYTDPTLNVPLTTGIPVPGSTTDSDEARIFSVLDAVVQVAVQAYGLRGNDFLPKIPVIFPSDATQYNPFDEPETIEVSRTDALDWDVIFHEYGHYLVHKGATSKFTDGEINCSYRPADGCVHPVDNTLLAFHPKDQAMRIAWREGWANFFAIAAQVEPSSSFFGIVLPNIPNAGDRIYHDTEDVTFTFDLETIADGDIRYTDAGKTKGRGGYAHEFSIEGALYDLIDADADSSSDSGARDIINVTPKVIWDFLNTGDWNNVGKVYSELKHQLLDNLEVLLQISEIFAMNNIAPELQLPANNSVISSTASPTFRWRANGDFSPKFQHNKFDLLISKDNFSSILMTKAGITTNEYTFSAAEWQSIVQAGAGGREYTWVVGGYNEEPPTIPAIGKKFQGFLSNAHKFRFTSPPARYRGAGSFRSQRSISWGSQGTIICDSSPSWEITLFADGTLKAEVLVTREAEFTGFGDDAEVICRDYPRRSPLRLSGTHSNGEFSIPYGGYPDPIKGTYNANSITIFPTWSYKVEIEFDDGTLEFFQSHSFTITKESNVVAQYPLENKILP